MLPPMSGERLRVVALAYACEPGAGSEEGAGWGLVEAALGAADVTVLSAPRHAGALRAWEAAHPDAGLSVVVVPDPPWGAAAQSHRIGRFLTDLAWLRSARRVAAGLLAGGGYDLAWHVSYSVYWLPSPVAQLGVPAVWGPVGGGVTAPRRLRPLLGWRGRLSERLDAWSVRLMARLPATRRTWRRVAVTLIQNEATADRLGTSGSAPSATLLNHSLFVAPAGSHRGRPGAPAVWAGALETRKGPALAVRALAASDPAVTLRMYGDGPELERVRHLAAELGVAGRLELMGRVPRAALLEELTACSAALFTGLYEEGGLALAEALATGVPTVLLDHGGAGTIARRARDPRRVARVPAGGVDDTARALGAVLGRFVADPPAGEGPLLDREAAVAELVAALRAAAAG